MSRRHAVFATAPDGRQVSPPGTGPVEVPLIVRAIRAGVIDFHDDQTAGARIASLTERERQVFERLVAGLPNKVIAHQLEISPRTVEVHRAHVMDKLQATSVSELVRLAFSVGLDPPSKTGESVERPQRRSLRPVSSKRNIEMTQDHGEKLLLAEALAFTIESLLQFPDTRRPSAEIVGMQKILATYDPGMRQTARFKALNWLRPESVPHHRL